MLTTRIIPCLDTRDGTVVKGIRFSDLRELGDPTLHAKRYEEGGADELVLLDVSATPDGRKTAVETVQRVRNVLSIALTVGGGVRSTEDVERLLAAGADKVSVNTRAVQCPELLSQMADKFGRQCTVLALDAAKADPDNSTNSGWEVVVESGKTRTSIDAVAWAQEAERRGTGEILLTSWDKDGTRSGYDLELLRAMSSAVEIPIIASGGANTPEHMASAIDSGADAVLAASIFHDGDYTIGQVKQFLSDRGYRIRL